MWKITVDPSLNTKHPNLIGKEIRYMDLFSNVTIIDEELKDNLNRAIDEYKDMEPNVRVVFFDELLSIAEKVDKSFGKECSYNCKKTVASSPGITIFDNLLDGISYINLDNFKDTEEIFDEFSPQSTILITFFQMFYNSLIFNNKVYSCGSREYYFKTNDIISVYFTALCEAEKWGLKVNNGCVKLIFNDITKCLGNYRFTSEYGCNFDKIMTKNYIDMDETKAEVDKINSLYKNNIKLNDDDSGIDNPFYSLEEKEIYIKNISKIVDRLEYNPTDLISLLVIYIQEIIKANKTYGDTSVLSEVFRVKNEFRIKVNKESLYRFYYIADIDAYNIKGV